MHGKPPPDHEALKYLHDKATQPELVSWLGRNPDRAEQLRPDEVSELLTMQGPGGPLERVGVDHFVDLIERRRKLLARVKAIAGTEYLGMLEQFVGLIYEKVEPAAARDESP
jgi:hypothetical protein